MRKNSFQIPIFQAQLIAFRSGLGLATCTRLIDEFIQTRIPSQSLHLIITTRSSTKGNATIKTLQNHVNRNPLLKTASDRLTFSSHEVDLTQLRTVLFLSKILIEIYPYLNTLICNAGIMGTEGVNWPAAIWALLRHPIQATTWPSYNIHSLRTLTRPQLDTRQTSHPEPPLGDIFAANVFGHYMLAAHLMPLFFRVPQHSAPARIIWTSSIETYAASFSAADIQCLDRREAYSSSKRLTDILVLTSHLSSVQSATNPFFSSTPDQTPSSAKRPELYLSHPGVCSTDILPLFLPLRWGKNLSFYLARWLGSKWHTISTYKGSVATVWLTLSPTSTLQGIEAREGKAKWGSATDLFGRERVMRTFVEGWGLGGSIGCDVGVGGRKSGMGDLTAVEREEFEELGVRVWKEMETLRMEWEGRLAG